MNLRFPSNVEGYTRTRFTKASTWLLGLALSLATAPAHEPETDEAAEDKAAKKPQPRIAHPYQRAANP